MGDLINLGAGVSAFASALGTATGASRILFAMGRDGFATPRLGGRRPTAPARPRARSLTVIVIARRLIVDQRLVRHSTPSTRSSIRARSAC